MKVLLIHIGKEGSETNIKLLPMGMLALADHLLKNKFDPLIVHAGLEKTLDPSFNLKRFIVKGDYSVILLDLYWFYQIFDVLQVIKDLKSDIKNLRIVLGGLTASIFSRELMRACQAIDFIIKDDPELPLLNLLHKLTGHKNDFSDIPNLVWRKNKKLIENHTRYSANEAIINKLRYSNFRLIHNYKYYIKLISNEFNERVSEPIFYYSPTRRCCLNCSFCGGGFSTMGEKHYLKKRLFINTRSTLNDFKELKKYNISGVYLFGIPGRTESRHYINLFRKIRQSKINLNVKFEYCSNRLPNNELIDEFSRTFKRGAILSFFPDSGSEKVRKKNRGAQFSNDDLLDTLRHISTKGNIKAYISFMAGLPFEGKKDVLETLSLISTIKKECKNIGMRTWAIDINPSTLLQAHPKKYGVFIKRKTFKDFRDFSRQDFSLGYRTKHFSDKEICEIEKLYSREIHCKYQKSRFLIELSRPDSAKVWLNLKDAHKYCLACKDYRSCYRNTLPYPHHLTTHVD